MTTDELPEEEVEIVMHDLDILVKDHGIEMVLYALQIKLWGDEHASSTDARCASKHIRAARLALG